MFTDTLRNLIKNAKGINLFYLLNALLDISHPH